MVGAQLYAVGDERLYFVARAGEPRGVEPGASAPGRRIRVYSPVLTHRVQYSGADAPHSGGRRPAERRGAGA